MIQTFADKEHIVQAIRMTGTSSSARAICRWLSISSWNTKPLGDGTYKVIIPGLYSHDNEDRVAVKDCWVVRDSQSHVIVLTNSEFKAIYERI